MKKTLIALTLSTVLLGGCVSTGEKVDYANVGNEIAGQKYQASAITDLEKIRMPIEATFTAAQGIYNSYMAKVEQSPAYNNYLQATAGKDEDEIKAIRAKLTEEDLKSIADFEESNSNIISEMMELAVKLYAMNETFLGFNAMGAIMQVDFNKMGEEKDGLSYTVDQLDYLMGTIGHIYKLSSIDNANKNMS
ncbi:MAG: hypothetical protein ACJAXJ_000136 [Colwellia sp.]|jgi:hypothetical protein